MTDQVLTVKEVADFLKVNERTVYRMATTGRIPAFKVGTSWRFKRE
jgi:excisionase family DNA binding protein